MATHLEKFKALMDEMGVEYKENKAIGHTFLELKEGKKVKCLDGADTTLEFLEDGSLREITVMA